MRGKKWNKIRCQTCKENKVVFDSKACKDCKRNLTAYRREKREKKKKLDENKYPPITCRVCGKTKPWTRFAGGPTATKCRTCKRKERKREKQFKDKHWYLFISDEERKKYAARRYKQMQLATPNWADKEKVREFYKEAKETGKQVDHIIPIQHKKVCGLHCEHNLQLLTRKQNFHKSNNFRI